MLIFNVGRTIEQIVLFSSRALAAIGLSDTDTEGKTCANEVYSVNS